MSLSGLLQTCLCYIIMFVPDEQVAEIISDVREPIVPVPQIEDENEKRKRQVRVSFNTN